jgi:hypothetical protein
MNPMNPTIKERLLAKAVSQGDCLIWTGGNSKTSGYGLIWADGRHQSAHRISYLVHHGEIPAGAVVMHSCDNRLCINPAHLSLGNQRANTADMLAKGRGNKASGEAHGLAKLSNAQRDEIYRRYTPYQRGNSTCALAREFGVRQSTIYRIVRSKPWSDAYAS